MTLENSLPATSNLAPAPVARWRWWVSLCIIASLPLLASLSSLRRVGPKVEAGAMLPSTVWGLLLFCAMQLGIFGVLWGIAWAFSRANKDQLFLRFRGIGSLAWGALYSLLMRFVLGFIAVAVLVLLSLLGFDLKAMIEVMKANAENMKNAFGPVMASRDPLYRFMVITLISFVVAGVREELWRVATMAGITHLAPSKWTQARKNGVALGVSSVLFGMGHLYQGITGVISTTLLGLILGAIVLRHGSVWPAIMAHGCFNAVSFAALSAVGAK